MTYGPAGRAAARDDSGNLLYLPRREGEIHTGPGLDYAFEAEVFAAGSATGATVTAATDAPLQVRSGAFEDMQAGRSSECRARVTGR